MKFVENLDGWIWGTWSFISLAWDHVQLCSFSWDLKGVLEAWVRKREENQKQGMGTSQNTLLFYGFWVWCVKICIFLILFPETRLSKVQFRLLNHLIWICIKIDMIFGSWLLCKHPCFDIGSEITSNYQDFDSMMYVYYF